MKMKTRITNYFMVAIMLIFMPVQTFSATLGDINADGKIDLAEVIYALKVVAGNTPSTELYFQYSTEWLTGKTLYNTYFDSDTSKWEIATFVFASNNGTATDTSRPGENFTFTYTITTDGILQLTSPDFGISYVKAISNTADYQQLCWDDFSIDAVIACTGSNEYFYFDQTKAHAFVTDKNNNLPNVNALVSGKVTFLGASEQILSIPTDALIAMTPLIYQNDAAGWTRLVCKIADDGSFGTDCFTHDPYAILAPFANNNETFQVAVIKNHIEPIQQGWDCGEDLYKYVSDNLPHSSLTNTIIVRPTDYQDSSADQCGN